MKVENEPIFSPLLITLETPEEIQLVHDALDNLNRVSLAHTVGYTKDQVVMLLEKMDEKE